MKTRNVYQPDFGFRKLLEEKEQKDKNKKTVILILTQDEDSLGPTAEAIEEYCRKTGRKCFFILASEAFLPSQESDNLLVIHNFSGQGKKITINPRSAACFIRGSTLLTESGRILMRAISEGGAFMINAPEIMENAQNKLVTSFLFDKADIPTPRTSFINNEASIEVALKAIGGKFPVIVKTVTGAEGIGVIKIQKKENFYSIIQALWAKDAELLLQEYIPIEYDIRTLVLNGEILGATLRNKVKDDFRTNLSLGGKTQPYKLSEDEKKLILKVSKEFGGYLVGIDHIISPKKNLYVLEVNGSPGTQSEFADEKGKRISRDKLISTIVETASDRMTWKGHANDEADVIEKIHIDKVGSVKAKLDTGNDTYSVLHATNIEEKNNTVKFETIDGITLEEPVVGKVEINIGSGIKETRYIIKLDTKIDGVRYKGVKYTLSDRSENQYPVLVGQVFLKRADLSVDANAK